MVYWKQIGPMSWSDDGESIFFIYDNRSKDAIYKASTSIPNKAERLFESEQKIATLQAAGDYVYVSAGQALKVAVSDGTATPVTMPGYAPKAAFRSASGETVFVAPDKATGKDALWVQALDETISQIDPGPIDTSPGCGISSSGDRKRLMVPSPTRGWSILDMSPPFSFHGPGQGTMWGWVTNSRVLTNRSRECATLCDWDREKGLVPTILKSSHTYLQTSPNGDLISYPVGVGSPFRHRVNGLAVSKPDGSQYRLILDGNILPSGPLSNDMVMGWWSAQ